MELQFETYGKVGGGKFPDFVEFERTDGQLFFVDQGQIYGNPSERFHGDFTNPIWSKKHNVSPKGDNDISNLELKTLSGFGIVGCYRTSTAQKLIIYEFQHDISNYLDSGTITHSISDPVSRFRLSLENPHEENLDLPGRVLINESESLISPGAKVIFDFGMGKEIEDYPMGTFYVDRSTFAVSDPTINIDGRNKIGKVLSDQTLDENYDYWLKSISETLKDILDNAQLRPYEYMVQMNNDEAWFNFERDTTYTQAIAKIFESLPEWQIRELEDGTIVLGGRNYKAFDSLGTYTFQRNKDIFSREVERDDSEVYRRVCVYTPEFAQFVYKDVEEYQGWNLQTNKTMYVEVAEGSTMQDLNRYADELIIRLSNVGKLESFNGPFRPHLQVGDAAKIVTANGTDELGLITEITHEFGKNGFYTTFTVDSGGTLGRGRVSDFIKKLTDAKRRETNKGDSGVDTETFTNIARNSRVNVSSSRSSTFNRFLINDGKKFFNQEEVDGGLGWQPHPNDPSPYIVIDFGKQCVVNKVKLWLDYDELHHDTLPTYYQIQYWDARQWVTLLTVSSAITPEMEHEFSSINTSSLKFNLHQKHNGHQNWREIEIWGNN